MQERRLGDLLDLLNSKKATIGIFGSGYVGLPLACAFAEAGFSTVAGDTDERKVQAIQNALPYVEDEYVRSLLPSLVKSGMLTAEQDMARLASSVDFAVITVPTPLDNVGEPDLTFVVAASESIAKGMRPGKFVVLESSVYPGTTEDVVRPILERSGLKAGKDFGLAFSPERIDYGRVKFNIKRIPKVVGGITPLCTQIASRLYSSIIQADIVPVSNPRVAEATKMLENTYRFVNIALVNELAVLHEKLGIDFLEVISAAATKPFGFQPFYPGPGVGGHCIPKDPYYLVYCARQVGGSLTLVEDSERINSSMVNHLLGRMESKWRSEGTTPRGSKALILGLAFKADVSDVRNSPSIVAAERLVELGVAVSAYDPFVKTVSTKNGGLSSGANLESAAKDANAVILMTPHTQFREINLSELRKYVRSPATIVDSRGFWSYDECASAGFDYICLGRPDVKKHPDTSL